MASDPIVETMLDATADIGHPGSLSGLDSWYDGATLTKLAGMISQQPTGAAANKQPSTRGAL